MGLSDGEDIVMDGSDPPEIPKGGQSGAYNVWSNLVEEAALHPQYNMKVYPGVVQTYGKGPTFMDCFNSDQHAAMQEDNLYYPWASQLEWELALFLLHSSLSMVAIDQFLSLKLVSLAVY